MIAETIIDVTDNRDAIFGTAEPGLADLATGWMHVAILLAISMKLAVAVILHTLFVYAAARVVRAWNVYMFLFAVAFHYMTNAIVVP